MEGPGLFVNGIFVKLEEGIEEKKNGNLNSASPHFNFSLIIKKDESGGGEKPFKNIYQFLKKNILMNLDVISSETSVFQSKSDYLKIPPILQKKCKDRHKELLDEIEKKFKTEVTHWNSQKKTSKQKLKFETANNSNNNNRINKNSAYKLKECFVKLEKLKVSNGCGNAKMKKCSECDKTFENGNNYANHLRLHNKKVFKCSICDQCFTSKEQFKYHEAVHSVSDPFPCEYCGKCLPTREDLHAHFKSNHSNKFFRCTYCNERFRNFQRFESHLKTHSSEKPYECINGNVNISKENKSVKGYSCKICGKTFSVVASLMNHKKVHVVVKTYQCSRCKKVFTLEKEFKLHTSCERINCKCGKSFNSMSIFKLHNKVHEQEKELLGRDSEMRKPIIKIEKIDFFNYKKKENGKLKTSTRRRSK